ncbi:MAG: aspartate carbamoyltransferase [Bdellovibrionales bacterium GWA2_49_15]|nr:MAG: aspartate carbamoyltransferase [Bdellovibrionales bacterium GWA2_49_15]HAZ12448.1 aspartate carbamoyltransferase [Bdellovibrionales bacterium]
MNGFPPILAEINNLSKDQITWLLYSAKRFKLGVVPVGKYQISDTHQPIIATSFLENSTRTKHSFVIAIQKLGAMYVDFNAETSSLKKGESLEETLLTLSHQGVDLCIIRTSVSHQFDEFKTNPPIRIINGGDGINQHPSQALLDLMTFIDDGGEVKGRTVAIIGDCIHSRVAHSLMELLPQFGCKILLAGPEECLPKQLDSRLDTSMFHVTTDTEEAILKSDFLYLLRIQKERHSGPAAYYESYLHKHGVSLSRLEGLMANGKISKVPRIYHPGPANVGVELDMALLKSRHYRAHAQVTNSVYMRMSIIKAMLTNLGDVSSA